MQTLHTIAEIRAQIGRWKHDGLRVGFVPTMGNLHVGHISLISAALQHADRVVASVFVNPTQFGPNEDFDAYPRTLADDQRQLAEAGCHLLFAPSVDEIYPEKNRTWVDVDDLGDYLCGASRPGHFRGVTTVVSKLFNIVQPDIACFGEKDFQQLAIIRRMAKDLFMPLEIIGVPTARNANGLALSSRNGYLSDAEKTQASALYRTLQQIKQRIEDGANDYSALLASASNELSQLGFSMDYLSIADAATLAPATANSNELVIAVAAKLGKTRLIDNVTFRIEQGE